MLTGGLFATLSFLSHPLFTTGDFDPLQPNGTLLDGLDGSKSLSYKLDGVGLLESLSRPAVNGDCSVGMSAFSPTGAHAECSQASMMALSMFT